MGHTVADEVVEVLLGAGVRNFYGVPGDAIDPVIESVRRTGANFVQVRHEEGAALAASAEAKYTGRVAVCLGSSGPGAIHLINGLYDAKMDGAPVVAITGQVPTSRLGRDFFQEVNLNRLMDDVSIYNVQLIDPESASYIAARAVREALVRRGVSHINIPENISSLNSNHMDYDLLVQTPRYIVNAERAVELMDHSSRPAILVGGGAHGHGEQVLSLAEKLGAPVMYALNGKGSVPDTDPKVIGGVGKLGNPVSSEVLKQIDLLIMLGTGFPFVEYIPSVPIIQVDRNPSKLGLRVKTSISMTCEMGDFLREVGHRMKEKEDKFYHRFEPLKTKWMEEVRSKLHTPRLRPELLTTRLSELSPVHIPVVVDTGNVTMWVNRHFQVNSPRRFLFSSWLGTTGFGVPGALGVAMASGLPVLALVGDGGFTMTMQELLTIRKYRAQVKLVIYNNASYGMVKSQQEAAGFTPHGVDLDNPDFLKLGESFGVRAMRVSSPRELEYAIKWLFQVESPSLLEAVLHEE